MSDDNAPSTAQLETRIDGMDAKLDQLLAAGHAKAEDHVEQRLDRPATVEEQVRAELARAREQDATERQAEQEKSEFQEMKDRLAKLGEVRPAAPQPKRERVMWGRR
jgi:hypothetical protein